MAEPIAIPGESVNNSPPSPLLAATLVSVLAAAVACGPIVERAPFAARPDTVLPADLLGPYDGIVIDADTDRPIAGATVTASWAFERGIGMQGPLAADEVAVETGSDGRYRIARLGILSTGLSTRLRRFTLIVYRRGYVGWRSDRRFRDEGRRRDFSQRGNRVRLEKWQSGDRHVRHLVFLGGGSSIRAAASWELQPAALELEGARAGTALPSGEKPIAAGAAGTGLLEVSGLLSTDEIRGVTGYVGKFEEGKLTDLPSTEFYDSRHFKASGRPESYDVALRVWRLGPAAAEAQYRKLLAELPGATPADEIGDASLRARADEILGLAFLSRDRGVVVSLTCGTAQCQEPGILFKLAKLVEGRLGELPEPAESPEQERP